MSLSAEYGDERPIPLIRDESRCYTAAEAAAAAGLPAPDARRYWRALGYPSVDDGAAEFTASDVELLRLITGYVADGSVDEADTLRIARVLSRALANVARLQVDIVAGQISQARDRGGDDIDPAQALITRMPEVDWLLEHLWRRHLTTAVAAFESDTGSAVPSATGVGFADIVGFTQLSSDRSDAQLTRVVARFEYRVTEIVADCGGNVLKMLGDEVLFTADDPIVLADIATRMVATFDDDADIPGLRVGIALGPVIRHLGDVFGTTVNLASRLTRLAEPNTVLASPDLAEKLADRAGYGLNPLEPTDIRGIGRMRPVELVRHAAIDG